jgi:pseudouridine synthase
VIADLITDLPHRVYPVGRLDYNSEGVVLLTNDGKLAHALAHPSYQIPRTYHVKLRGSPSNAKLQQLLKGVMLEDGLAQALHVERINSTPAGHLWLEIVLTEGRNREIRRMCEAIGHSVTRLVRKRFANIHVDDLRPGEYQILTQDDIQTLYELIGSSNK